MTSPGASSIVSGHSRTLRPGQWPTLQLSEPQVPGMSSVMDGGAISLVANCTKPLRATPTSFLFVSCGLSSVSRC